MKKVLSLALALSMLLCFVACGGDDKPANEPEVVKEPTSVELYVEENGQALADSYDQGFESSGMHCTTTVTAEGYDIILTSRIEELDGLDSDMKAQMQDAFDELGGSFKSMFQQVKDSEISELESFTLVICEKDGDKIATVKVDLD